MNSTAYRADIDGLRALAVLAVVGFHAFPAWMPGGFIGVDVFFVISGYLISGILLKEIRCGELHIVRFYARRVRRIFPALFVVLASSLAIGWLVLLGDEYAELGKHVAAGAGFVSNLVLWQESGYFDTAAESKILLHLWSLGIEEQFYIVWPLLLWLAARLGLRLCALTALLALASFACNVALIDTDMSGTFYSPQTRSWELLLGAMLACLALSRAVGPARTIRALVARHPVFGRLPSPIGAALVGSGLFLITREHAFPGYWALLPAVGTMLLIAGGPQAWLNRHVLASRPLVGLGLISYPLYLWHWPLLTYGRIVVGGTPSPLVTGGLVLLAGALAWLTWRLIERPFRQRTRPRRDCALLVALIAGVGLAGYQVMRADGLAWRIPGFDTVRSAAGELMKFENTETLTLGERQFQINQGASEDTTLVIGDSNAEQYFPRLAALRAREPEHLKRVIFATGGGCSPIPAVRSLRHPACASLTADVLRLLQTEKRVTTIAIAAFWPNYLTNADFGSHVMLDGNRVTVGLGNAAYREALASLARYIADLRRASGGARIVLVLNIPYGDEFDPLRMLRRDLAAFPHVLRLQADGISLDTVAARHDYGALRRDLVALAAANGAVTVDPLQHLCDATRCVAVDAHGRPNHANPGHLNATYVREQVTYMDQLFLVQ